MAIFDFLKEIPISAVLREKLKDIEAQLDELKSQNKELREACEAKDAEIQALSIKLLPPPVVHLDERQEAILGILAQHEELPEQVVAELANVGVQVVAYHLEELRRRKYVYASHIAGSDWSGQPPRTDWSLQHAGRAYLLKNGLLS